MSLPSLRCERGSVLPEYVAVLVAFSLVIAVATVALGRSLVRAAARAEVRLSLPQG